MGVIQIARSAWPDRERAGRHLLPAEKVVVDVQVFDEHVIH